MPHDSADPSIHLPSQPPCALPSPDLQALVLRLNLRCAQKDAEIASLRAAILIESLRKHVGASDTAIFNPADMTFVADIPDPARAT